MHESIAGTGSICLAAAARIPGSTVFGLTRQTGQDVIRIGHPSGVTPAQVRARAIPGGPGVRFEELGFSRIARRLIEGRAFYPREDGPPLVGSLIAPQAHWMDGITMIAAAAGSPG